MKNVPAILVLALMLTACGRPVGEPADLTGTWRSGTPGVVLEFQADAFRLQSGHLTKWGTAVRTPFRVAFVLERTSSPAFDLYCRETVDVYDWYLDDAELTFDAVGRPCDRAARAVLVAGVWTRESA